MPDMCRGCPRLRRYFATFSEGIHDIWLTGAQFGKANTRNAEIPNDDEGNHPNARRRQTGAAGRPPDDVPRYRRRYASHLDVRVDNCARFLDRTARTSRAGGDVLRAGGRVRLAGWRRARARDSGYIPVPAAGRATQHRQWIG